jgi:DNA-binding MurR/RpiR family transcriptional regulator
VKEELDDFQHRLESRLPSLTKSQQRIASYLLANYDEAAFLSSAELADRLDLSEATMARFAQAVGYEDFRELRRCLQGLFRAQAMPASRLQRKLSELASSQGHVLTKVLAMELQYLTETSQSIDLDDFDRAVDILLSGERIFVFASGPSGILADLAMWRFRRLGIPTVTMTESGRHLLENLQLLQAEDAVLVAGFQHLTTELNTTLNHARAIGCHSILLTDTLGPVLGCKADVTLAARRGPVSTFHSLTVPMSVLNALILAVAMARPEESLTALNRLQQLRATSGLQAPG